MKPDWLRMGTMRNAVVDVVRIVLSHKRCQLYYRLELSTAGAAMGRGLLGAF
jgi:hypothetical protein